MNTKKHPTRFSKILLIIFILIAIAAITIPGWPFVLAVFQKPINQTFTETGQFVPPLLDLDPNAEGLSSVPDEEMSPPVDNLLKEIVIDDGIIVLSMADGLQNSLFLYHPQVMTFTRLTNPDSDDIHPAISPDGSRLAFSSRRNGYWDIYLLNLKDASLQKITDTPAYEGHPSWSPDGKWIAYEKYQNENFDIFIQALDQLEEASINLTQSSSNEFSPTWSPNGRILAYLSDADGSVDVWTADLNNTAQRFMNLTQSTTIEESEPIWNPRGTHIGWTALVDHNKTLYHYDIATSETQTMKITGDMFMWSPNEQTVISISGLSNGSLMNFSAFTEGLIFPSQFLTQKISSLDWRSGKFVDYILEYPFNAYRDTPQSPLYQPKIDTSPLPPLGRFAVVPLVDVTAPYPYIHDLANESFDALRNSIARQTGWDMLNSLENAFIPITVPSQIWNHQNWFYTGRAIAFNSSPISAGWVVLMKEEIHGETYWRIYAKCRYQDGSQGRPLKDRQFNLDARLIGDPEIYDMGGVLTSIPKGYWVDITDLAYRYNWERLPAMLHWQTFYPATRYNMFVFRQNLDWSQAMQEIVPAELIPTARYADYEKPLKSITASTPIPSIESTQDGHDRIRPTWTPVPGFDKP
jgi:TolB protein